MGTLKSYGTILYIYIYREREYKKRLVFFFLVYPIRPITDVTMVHVVAKRILYFSKRNRAMRTLKCYYGTIIYRV